jgi:hypothetical protein
VHTEYSLANTGFKKCDEMRMRRKIKKDLMARETEVAFTENDVNEGHR